MTNITTSPTSKPAPQRNRAWLRWSRTLHVYLSMLALLLLLFFGLTGFMLNHADLFGLEQTNTHTISTVLPSEILASTDKLLLVEYIRVQGVSGAVDPFEWPDEGEVFHLAFKSPRSHTDVDIKLPEGTAEIEVQTRGSLAMLSRMHTARESGAIWQLLLDAAAILLILISVTGLVLWFSLPKRRRIGMYAISVSVIGVAIIYMMFVP